MFIKNGCLALSLVSLGSVFSLVHADAVVPPDRGGPRFITWTNNYDFLKDEQNHTGSWQEKLNYIPLGSNPDNYMSIGGEIRYKYEYWEHLLLGTVDPDRQESIAQRLRLHTDVHLGNQLRLFVEIGDNWAFNEDIPIPPNYSAIDIQQAFLDYTFNLTPDSSVTLRPGRFTMPYGSGIMMGTRDGANMWYTYEGLRTFVKLGQNHKLDAVHVKPVQFKRGSFEDEADDTREFSAITYSYAMGANKLETYYYQHENENVVANYPNEAGPETRKSTGLRYVGKQERMDYDVEAIYQFGELGNADISAYSFMSDLGYTLPTSLRTRLGLRTSIYSGDDDLNDNEVGTFAPYYPRSGHLTRSGLLGLSNLIQFEPSISVSLNPKLNMRFAYGFYQKAQSEDQTYAGVPGRLANSTYSTSKDLAQVAEVHVMYSPTRNFNFILEMSHLKAQDALKEVGAKNTNYIALTNQFKF